MFVTAYTSTTIESGSDVSSRKMLILETITNGGLPSGWHQGSHSPSYPFSDLSVDVPSRMNSDFLHELYGDLLSDMTVDYSCQTMSRMSSYSFSYWSIHYFRDLSC